MRSIICLSLFVWLAIDVSCLRTLPSDPCDPINQRDSRTLRSDQLTVLINGYSESRIPILQSIAITYTASPVVSSVLVLWGNPSTSIETLAQLDRNLSLSSFGTATVSLVRQPSSSLNARFLPRPLIKTHAVLICDDDVEVDSKSVEFAFRVWSTNRLRMLGVFMRSHDIDLLGKEWIYTVHPDKYSIALTKFMMLNTEYLFKYSCGGGTEMTEMRRIVDRMNNCEDILMNFVVADDINAGPIMIGAKRARDLGDARNDDVANSGDGRIGSSDQERTNVREVGLSSRKAEHRKRRGHCIREFHRAMGRMPLRYSYGKVIDSVSEQGLCKKGGKLVFCDH